MCFPLRSFVLKVVVVLLWLVLRLSEGILVCPLLPGDAEFLWIRFLSPSRKLLFRFFSPRRCWLTPGREAVRAVGCYPANGYAVVQLLVRRSCPVSCHRWMTQLEDVEKLVQHLQPTDRLYCGYWLKEQPGFMSSLDDYSQVC